MRACTTLDPRAPLARAQETSSIPQLSLEIVAKEVRGTASERIVLAGFSQGGVVALQLGLSSRARFAGIMALSTYVHDHEHLLDRVSFESVDVPVFMAHGLMDPMIPIARAVTSREALAALNYQVEWREYGMGHQVCHQELVDIARWLNARFRA